MAIVPSLPGAGNVARSAAAPHRAVHHVPKHRARLLPMAFDPTS